LGKILQVTFAIRLKFRRGEKNMEGTHKIESKSVGKVYTLKANFRSRGIGTFKLTLTNGGYSDV